MTPALTDEQLAENERRRRLFDQQLAEQDRRQAAQNFLESLLARFPMSAEMQNPLDAALSGTTGDPLTTSPFNATTQDDMNAQSMGQFSIADRLASLSQLFSSGAPPGGFEMPQSWLDTMMNATQTPSAPPPLFPGFPDLGPGISPLPPRPPKGGSEVETGPGTETPLPSPLPPWLPNPGPGPGPTAPSTPRKGLTETRTSPIIDRFPMNQQEPGMGAPALPASFNAAMNMANNPAPPSAGGMASMPNAMPDLSRFSMPTPVPRPAAPPQEGAVGRMGGPFRDFR